MDTRSAANASASVGADAVAPPVTRNRPSDAAAPPLLAADADDIVPLGDFFTCRDYTTRTYTFASPSGAPPLTVTLDALAAASTDFDLTGQIVWVCSIVTSYYVAHAARALVAGEDVLELGAGCGLCGLTAAAFARRVFLTDNEPEVLSLLERNALAHGAGVVSVANLDWGSRDHEAALAAASRPLWKVILGADVIYWSHAVPLLFDAVSRLLAPDGVFVVGFTDRVNGLRDATEAAARAVGLTWTTVPLASFLPDPLPPELGPHTAKVTLFRFVWAAAPAAPG